MITGGIDAGIEYTKIVLMKDGEILAKVKGRSGGAKRAQHVQELWKEALVQAGMQETLVERICITGKGKYNTGMDGKPITELAAAQCAAQNLHPDARQVVVSGADETIVFERNGEKIDEYTINQKCSAGLGLFLEAAEDLLEVDLSSFEDVAFDGWRLNDACVSFANMDLLEGINQNCSKEQLAAAALRYVATKLSVVMNDITLPNEGKTIAAGGLFLYPAVKTLLAAHRAEKSLQVVADPDYFTAKGAAFYAAGLAG